MKYGQIWMKKYAERSEAKKKIQKIKRGPKKLNFGASKPGVKGGARAPRAPPPGSASENYVHTEQKRMKKKTIFLCKWVSYPLSEIRFSSIWTVWLYPFKMVSLSHLFSFGLNTSFFLVHEINF